MKLRATYSFVGSTVKVHAATCPNATDRPRGQHARSAWDLAATTLDAARDELNDPDGENLKARGWKIQVCPCAKEA